MNHGESRIQQSAIARIDVWFAANYPEYMITLKRSDGRPYRTAPVFAIQNAYAGADGNDAAAKRRAKQRGARSVKEGVKSGIADTFLPIARGGYNGLFIELKTATGTLSHNQRQWMEHCNKCNYLYRIARSADDFEKIIADYMQ